MYSQFDTVDEESDQYWNEKIEQAWKMFDKERKTVFYFSKKHFLYNGDGKLSQLEFRWMTDRKTLTNQNIKLMWSKCDTDGDGFLDFQEFKEMIMRARARRELKTLEDSDMEDQQMEIMKLEEKMKTKKSVYKVPDTETEAETEQNNEIDEDIEEERSRSEKVDDLSIEDDIAEELDSIKDDDNNESPKVDDYSIIIDIL